ncbi:PIN domain-containing protein [Methylicorpusculum oleiharenae]|uniref:PIN domain-containing protein n=1 Tax=Methylicorpusculum oleiharenae TaxID=1338687 RepID=UPI0013592B4B|nr:PIN domain-containing protein [Methylicorpusculum oleiharenae]MCD2449354.1 PIN domain-containing protein [Methylicorpusculum oleiharenae]
MQRVYLDACMVIHLVEGNSQQQQVLKRALLGQKVFSSELVRLESRIKALRENQSSFLMIYEQFFIDCQMIDLYSIVFGQTTDLRVIHHLKTPDALYLAAALTANCDQFWTNDQQLVKAINDKLQQNISVRDMADLEGML